MNELGFGMIQRSVWISPHDFLKDMWEFIKANELDNRVFILEAPHFLAGDSKILAKKVWKLDKLNDQYEALLDEVINLKQMYVSLYDRTRQRTHKSTEAMKGRCRKIARELRSRHLEVVLEDPFLPKELLPEDWVGERLKREIKKLK